MRKNKKGSAQPVPAEWSPGKLRVFESGHIPQKKLGKDCLGNYRILGKLNQDSHYQTGNIKYIFTLVHCWSLDQGRSALFGLRGEIEYTIRSKKNALTVELMLFLVNRAHLLFASEFDKMTKETALRGLPPPRLFRA